MSKFAKHRNKEKTNLSVATLLQLKDLFVSKKWEIVEDIDISIFNRYAQTLTRLTDEQQQFVLQLSKGFIHIPAGSYLAYLLKPLGDLRSSNPSAQLLFTCCLTQEDIGKTKSAHAVLYQIKGTTIKTRINLSPYYVIDGWENGRVWERIKDTEYNVVLVDDFVGTGETACAAIDYLVSVLPDIDVSRISVLSIVAMEEGKRRILGRGCTLYAHTVCRKAISDEYTDAELSEAVSTMETIERSLKGLRDDYKFGYKGSEALVCMERCPNNTFPIYWKTKNTAPYER